MGFAILRIQKLKSHVAMRGSLKHSFREQETPNADPNLCSNNEHIGATNSQEAIRKYNALLEKAAVATKGGKIRKNAVVACEFLITGSPEIINSKEKKDQDAYFQDALKWLKDRHGKENIVCAGIHRDETTPHMYVYVVPRDQETGRLNCRKFYGGHKDVMSKLQTEFHTKVGKKHGLDRGIENSKATHTRIKDYYKNINKAKPVKLTAEDLSFKIKGKKMGGLIKKYETEQEYITRLNEHIKPLNDAKKENGQLHQAVKNITAHNVELIKKRNELLPDFANGKKAQEVYLKRLQGFHQANEESIKAEIRNTLRFKSKTKENDQGFDL